MVAPTGGRVLIPAACDRVTLHGKGNFADVGKTIAMATVPWITWLGPRYPQGSLEEEGKKASVRGADARMAVEAGVTQP